MCFTAEDDIPPGGDWSKFDFTVKGLERLETSLPFPEAISGVNGKLEDFLVRHPRLRDIKFDIKNSGIERERHHSFPGMTSILSICANFGWSIDTVGFSRASPEDVTFSICTSIGISPESDNEEEHELLTRISEALPKLQSLTIDSTKTWDDQDMSETVITWQLDDDPVCSHLLRQ